MFIFLCISIVHVKLLLNILKWKCHKWFPSFSSVGTLQRSHFLSQTLFVELISLGNWKCDIIPDIKERLLDLFDLSVLEKAIFSINICYYGRDLYNNILYCLYYSYIFISKPVTIDKYKIYNGFFFFSFSFLVAFLVCLPLFKDCFVNCIC